MSPFNHIIEVIKLKNTRERMIHIHKILADNWKLMRRMEIYDSTFEIYDKMSKFELAEILNLSTEKASYLYQHLQKNTSEINPEFQKITIYDEQYPPLLKEIHDPPYVLYTLGNQNVLQSLGIGIVGTRTPTSYGLQSMEMIIKELPRELLIVSGLAIGIDSKAHELSLKYGNPTIAVIGSGFHHLYPAKNKLLAEEIIGQNLLITEYPPTYTPRKWYFPKRNRIISGLTLGTVIVEAKEKSGSLITADCAMEQGREVFAIPGNIQSVFSKGCNQLIQQGAKLIYSAQDILDELYIFSTIDNDGSNNKSSK